MIPIISASGKVFSPTVIFQGKFLRGSSTWENPLGTVVHMSEKRYMTGVIGREWIKCNFNPPTHQVANGHARLLIVDGHTSHFTQAFLEYAKKSNIHVLCLPPHTTHALQTLGVVGFSQFKQYYHQDLEENTGPTIGKGGFLAMIAGPYWHAFTPENIKRSFEKTGTWPIDHSQITTEMTAPSCYGTESSGWEQ